MQLTQRKATLKDVQPIVKLLFDDQFGKTRENIEGSLNQYKQAFQEIDRDYNHYLMIVENNQEIVATCHLTIIPSLSHNAKKRMQIESVRVASQMRGQKIGEWMIKQAVEIAKARGVSIIQLTTNKERVDAKRFYEKLGFKASHEGMKLVI